MNAQLLQHCSLAIKDSSIRLHGIRDNDGPRVRDEWLVGVASVASGPLPMRCHLPRRGPDHNPGRPEGCSAIAYYPRRAAQPLSHENPESCQPIVQGWTCQKRKCVPQLPLSTSTLFHAAARTLILPIGRRWTLGAPASSR